MISPSYDVKENIPPFSPVLHISTPQASSSAIVKLAHASLSLIAKIINNERIVIFTVGALSLLAGNLVLTVKITVAVAFAFILIKFLIFVVIDKALENKTPSIIRAFRKFNNMVNGKPRSVTLLMQELKHGSFETVQALLDYDDIDVNKKDVRGDTALKYAVKNRRTKEIIALLNKPDLDINSKNYQGRTSLIDAVYRNQDAVPLLLADPRTNPNLQDKDTFTALMYAVKENKPEIVRALLACSKTNPKLINKDGETAFILAKKYRHDALIPIFKEFHHKKSLQELAFEGDAEQFQIALPTASKADKEQSLAIACDLGHLSIVKQLKHVSGIDLNTTIKSKTPLALAAGGLHLEVTRELLTFPGLNIDYEPPRVRNGLSHNAIFYVNNQFYFNSPQANVKGYRPCLMPKIEREQKNLKLATKILRLFIASGVNYKFHYPKEPGKRYFFWNNLISNKQLIIETVKLGIEDALTKNKTSTVLPPPINRLVLDYAVSVEIYGRQSDSRGSWTANLHDIPLDFNPV